MPQIIPLPKLEDYKTPWEKSGEELDPERAKVFVHSLLGQNENLTTKVTDLTKAKNEAIKAQKKAEEELNAAGEGDSDEVARLKGELGKAQKALADYDVESDPRYIRLQVATENGLDEFETRHIAGNTKEELEESAKEFVDRRKAAAGSGSGNGGDPVSHAPRRQLRNAGDPVDDPTSDEVTDEELKRLSEMSFG